MTYEQYIQEIMLAAQDDASIVEDTILGLWSELKRIEGSDHPQLSIWAGLTMHRVAEGIC